MSNVSKGAYQERKTIEWLEGLGYSVLPAKDRRVKMLKRDDGVLTARVVTRDMWGCDVVAMNQEEMVWVQVKSNPGQVSGAIKELLSHPWPKSEQIQVWVVWWPHRRRKKDGPEITVVPIPEPEPTLDFPSKTIARSTR